jgi:hypothetical protein
MLKPTPSRVVWALLCGFCLILIAAWFSGSTGEICKETKSGHEQCAPYNLAPFILIQIREALHSIEGVVTALATIAIAAFTWTLWKSSEKMWDATDRNVRAAIALQLPVIRVEPDLLAHEETGDSESCYIHAVIVGNATETKAFPKEILYGWTFGDKLSDQPSYQFSDPFPPNIVVSDSRISKKLSGLLVLKKGQWSEISKGNCLWFYCDLLYDDFMGEGRHHAFCWRWTNVGMGVSWRIDATPAYNRKT